jgi:serine/threonine protein phosphatase PrpC
MGLYVRVAAHTDAGRIRKGNEDAFVVADLTRGERSSSARWTGRVEVGRRGALVAVADGVGGAQAGELASALVVASLASALERDDAPPNSEAKLGDAVKNAHETVFGEACARGIKMGATLTALYVRGTAAYLAEVGDSRAYLLRAGQMTQLTKDQSYVQMLVDAGAVKPEDAPSMAFRNVILQAMGHQPRLSVALGRLELRRRDCILLCSDGLSNEVSDTDMRALVLGSPDLVHACDRLIQVANERGGHDNITAVLVGVGGDLPAPVAREPVEETYRVLESFDA